MEWFDMEQSQQWLDTFIIPWGLNILFALLIFVFGKWISKGLTKLTHKLLEKANLDEILINFLSGIVHTLLMLFVIIAALSQLGVDTTSLIALLGAAGLAVGLALKDSLQNFASGVMLILFRPFKTGDFVDAGGVMGVVEKISIFSTQMRTGDNKEVIVPNGNIYGGVITNFSARETRRIDMSFGISYDDDIRKAKDLILSVIESDERILKDPAPLVAVAELADSSVNFNVRPWVNSGDYWPVFYDLNEKIKITFDENDITIPYPQMDVHLDKGDGQ